MTGEIEYAYGLRTINGDRTSERGFLWPPFEGTPLRVTAIDDGSRLDSGIYVLHEGRGLAQYLTRRHHLDPIYQVVRYPRNRMYFRYAPYCARVPWVDVLYEGDRADAVAYLIRVQGGRVVPVYGSVHGTDEDLWIGGEYSTITAGEASTLIGDRYSTLSAGDRSTLLGHDRSTLKAGAHALLTGGQYATLTGGDGARLLAGDYATLTAGDNALVVGGRHAIVKAGSCSTLVAGAKSSLTGGTGAVLTGDWECVLTGGYGATLIGGAGSVYQAGLEATIVDHGRDASYHRLTTTVRVTHDGPVRPGRKYIVHNGEWREAQS